MRPRPEFCNQIGNNCGKLDLVGSRAPNHILKMVLSTVKIGLFPVIEPIIRADMVHPSVSPPDLTWLYPNRLPVRTALFSVD